MAAIDESLPFIPVRFAVLTVSDTRSLEEDRSGQTLVERIEKAGHVLAERAIVPDDIDEIRAIVSCWILARSPLYFLYRASCSARLSRSSVRRLRTAL